MPDRPEGVPSEAVWSQSDNEWTLLPTDEDGNTHGKATYWRPDGTLVNHCMFEHGKPHGWYKRYHQSGEVSREGTFASGRLHGTDVFTRSDKPTTENFPAGLSERVWRAEMDLRNGSVVGGRCYDKDGRQVSETGELYPDRPASVPEAAVFSAQGGRWLLGSTDEDFARHGLWRFYQGSGELQQEVEYEHGSEKWNRIYGSSDEAEAEVALREGRADDALTAAGRLWSSANVRPDDLVVAGDLQIRCMDAAGRKDEARTIAEEVSSKLDSIPVHWGVFTTSGKQCYLALGRCLTYLAHAQLEGDDAERALVSVNRAIDLDYHYGTAEPRALKVRILQHAGKDDEAFQVAREVLSRDPDAAGLEDIAEGPEFAAWLKSISAESMTCEGAREVLGRRGEKLMEVVAPIALEANSDDSSSEGEEDEEAEGEEDDGEMAVDTDWPITDALGDNLSPELRRFVADEIHMRIQDTYRGEFRGAVESDLSGAQAAQDGTWLARIQTVFLPASAMLIEDEQFWIAAWHPTSGGTSRVYYQHQDEPEMYRTDASLAGFLARRMLEDTGYEELVLPAALREQLSRAVQLEPEGDTEEFPAHLDVMQLEPRTLWIVDHLTGIALGDGLANAPSMQDWATEKKLAPEWPHLQAYWLLHHMVFDNREELAELASQCDERYPAVRELTSAALQMLSNEPVTAPFWDDTKVRGLRAQAMDSGHGVAVMSEAAQARTKEALAARGEAEGAMAKARAALEAAGDESVAEVFGMWELLESAAGDITNFEQALVQQAFKDQDDSMSYFMRQRTGHVSILGRVMMSMGEHIDEKWKDFFGASVLRGAEMSEEHASAVPGSLYGLGLALGDFSKIMERIESMPFYPDEFGRRRRLEVSLVAEKLWDQEPAQAFLVAETERFVPQFSSWQTDTVILNLWVLLDKGHPRGAELFNQMMEESNFSGANWKSAIGLCTEMADRNITAIAPGLLAAVNKGLGRHDDGDRSIVVRAYAKNAGKDAIPVLQDMLGSIEDVRVDCERAALLSGLLAVDADNGSWVQEAKDCIQRMLGGRFDSMRFGATIPLLQAAKEAGGTGFSDVAAAVWERAKDDKYAKEPLKKWLEEHKDAL